MSYHGLLVECEVQFNTIKVTAEQSKTVEEKTRNQAASKLWFQQRAGRITASKLKAEVQTDINKPSQSLIKAIGYPESQQFYTEATLWGQKHEATASQAYIAECTKNHTDLSVLPCGLIINQSHPYLAATPDGIINCECCGSGVLEIKCPFSCTGKTLLEATADPTFYLEEKNGELQLKTDHAYYYQVQAQMNYSGAKYGDFVVWSQNELVIQRIYLDETFISSILPKATEFFTRGILPELLLKWWSKPALLSSIVPTSSVPSSSETTSDSSGSSTNELWCYCRKEESGTMIVCDNEFCKIVWFHTSCLKLTRIPKGKWKYPKCRKKKH